MKIEDYEGPDDALVNDKDFILKMKELSAKVLGVVPPHIEHMLNIAVRLEDENK